MDAPSIGWIKLRLSYESRQADTSMCLGNRTGKTLADVVCLGYGGISFE